MMIFLGPREPLKPQDHLYTHTGIYIYMHLTARGPIWPICFFVAMIMPRLWHESPLWQIGRKINKARHPHLWCNQLKIHSAAKQILHFPKMCVWIHFHFCKEGISDTSPIHNCRLYFSPLLLQSTLLKMPLSPHCTMFSLSNKICFKSNKLRPILNCVMQFPKTFILTCSDQSNHEKY